MLPGRSIIFVVVFSAFLICMGVLGERSCQPYDLELQSCSLSEICDEISMTCRCSTGYKRKNETECVQIRDEMKQSTPSSSSLVEGEDEGDDGNNSGGGASITAGIFIPLVLVTLGISATYIAKKFRLVDWLRNKTSRRDVNYDEFMIGRDQDDEDDDDPPLR